MNTVTSHTERNFILSLHQTLTVSLYPSPCIGKLVFGNINKGLVS